MPAPTPDASGRPPAPAARYHHGDLETALLAAAERLLERGGIQALTLRATAREAGVSHAAPAYHFGDLTGLLSDLAAVGFDRLAAALRAAAGAAGADPAARLAAMGRAYVGFARAHRGLFALMFRSERLDATLPRLREALAEARRVLRAAIAARSAAAPGVSPLAAAARATAAWALVHGFALLLLDGRLDGTLAGLPGGEDAAALLAAMLEEVRIGE
jgi:AcrR family transcriptional regulator